jgi:hypothetical protein
MAFGGLMGSWVHTVRWMVFGTLTLSACGSSSDAGALLGTGGAGYSSGGGQSSGGASSSGGSAASGTGGSNVAGTTSGTGNVTGGGDGGFPTGTGGSRTGAGGASNGSGGTAAGMDGGVDTDGGDAGGRTGGGGTGAGGRPANCPMRAPANLTMCTMAEQGTACTYGAEMCTCTMQAGRLDWRCMRSTGGVGGVGGTAGAGGTGGNAANCPMSAPMSGGMCTRATRPGQSNNCRYGTDECTCGGIGAMSTWTCLSCPATTPMTGGMCTNAGTCTYTTGRRTTSCTCRAPIRGAGGASMTWACL